MKVNNKNILSGKQRKHSADRKGKPLLKKHNKSNKKRTKQVASTSVRSENIFNDHNVGTQMNHKADESSEKVVVAKRESIKQNSYVHLYLIAFIGGLFALSVPFIQHYMNNRYRLSFVPKILHVDASDTAFTSHFYYEVSFGGHGKSFELNHIELLIPEIDWRPISVPIDKKYSFIKDTILFDSIAFKYSTDIKAANISFKKMVLVYSVSGEESPKTVMFTNYYHQLQYNEIGKKGNVPDSMIVKYGSLMEVLFHYKKDTIYYWPNNLEPNYTIEKDTIFIEYIMKLNSLNTIGAESDSCIGYYPRFVIPNRIKNKIVLPEKNTVSYTVETRGKKDITQKSINFRFSKKGFFVIYEK